MKKQNITLKFIAVLLAFTALSVLLFSVCVPSYASDTASSIPINWYTKRNSTHSLFELDKELEFINDYNAFYADKKAASANEKVIYLTFDAGYENGNVEKILNVLNKHKAPGAFFILENFAKQNPSLLKRMDNEGHLICNHTATHPDMTKLTSKAKFDMQLQKLENYLKDNYNINVAKYYRPPEGRFSRQNLQFANELGYKTVFWSFAYADWDNNDQPSVDYAIKKILDNVHPGEIMLLHPTSKTNAAILDTVLTQLKEMGYRFGSLDQIQ